MSPLENQPPGSDDCSLPRESKPESQTFRAEILGRVAAWVDEILGAESPPAGVPSDQLAEAQREVSEPTEGGARPDLYSLWSAIVALTQETRLQGRAFKQLHGSLDGAASLAEAVTSLRQAREDSLAAVRTAAGVTEAARQREDAARQAGQESARDEMLEVLLDVRDRLVRGLDAARAPLAAARDDPKRHWLDRLRRRPAPRREPAAEAAEAMAKGYALALEGLDEHLDSMGVREIECPGRPFDHEKMTAVDVEYTAAAAEGVVLGVYRAGYQRHGQVLRTAEVKVARRPHPAPDASKDAKDD